ncbi:Probable methyltransferase At1g27930 [Linum perenne]
MKSRRLLPDKSWILAVVMAGLVFAGVLIGSFIRSADTTFLCSLASQKFRAAVDYASTPQQLQAIVHYATSQTTPTTKFPRDLNFLIFGLGFDSLMWSSLNPRGCTIFLEEDPSWVKSVLNDAPTLDTYTVQYRTQFKEADRLLNSYRKEPLCSPAKTYLRGNYKCTLALTGLPEEVYEKEWDVIMIDAPRGWF